jgi:zinc transport system substrate-binding protein
VAAFYPLAYAAQGVLGDQAEVVLLTPPGAEPHDVELSPQQVAQLQSADLVLYIPGFQPAVDDAVADLPSAVDVAEGISVLPAEEHGDEHGHEHGDEHGHEHGETTFDPHIWLNPLNMTVIGQTIADRAAGAVAEQALADNLASFSSAMTALNGEWAAGTAECARRDLVVSHEAFAYLAAQYDFTQVGIAGLSPETEPSPARIAEVADFVRANGVTTIYYETLVDPKVAETIAVETGASTAVLDPIEGLTEGASGDYASIMRDNLATVRAGQSCT